MQNSSKPIKLGSLSTSDAEIKDIIKAWVAVSAAFAIGMSGSLLSAGFYRGFIIASLTVGLGFLLHELAHKIVAQRFGCFAQFRSFDMMLMLAVLMSFFGFVFAAPGAVMIAGRVNHRKNGLISAAGPIVNLILALVFLALNFASLPGIVTEAAYYGFLINSWLALFNLIPFWIFDGQKIWRWNKVTYSFLAAAAMLLMSVSYFVKIPA